MSTEPANRRDVLEMDREIIRLRRTVKQYVTDNRVMRSFLIRLNSARIAMNNESVCKTLDEIDSWFRSDKDGE